MAKALTKIAAAICGIAIIIAVIVGCVRAFAFNRNFYVKEYAKLDTAESIGISEEDLTEATEALLSYMEDKRDDLVVYAEFAEGEEEVFGEREKLHMVDVKNLYLGAMTAGIICACMGVIGIVLLFIKNKRAAAEGYLIGNAVFFVAFGALAIFAATDFNMFWYKFHQVFFTNDLWLLDPATDVLIQMVPSQFFFDLVMRIAVTAVIIIAILIIAACIVRRVMKKREA